MKFNLLILKILPFFVFLFITNKNFATINTVIDTSFHTVLKERTSKILAPLEIKKNHIYKKVQNILIQQYIDVNKLHEDFKVNVAAIKTKQLSSNLISEEINQEEETKRLLLSKLHTQFIKKIFKKLNFDQVEKIKDGMTYNVLPKTWAAYLDMLQNLTKEQKDKMYAWLLEARELAMDEGSSEKKHAVFGKYKGRINNYLSGQGYDMKKESHDWEERLKEKKTNQNKSN